MDIEIIQNSGNNNQNAAIEFMPASVLYKLPELEENFLAGVITSPPYCNRYDYTRTYALELVYLGLGEQIEKMKAEKEAKIAAAKAAAEAKKAAAAGAAATPAAPAAQVPATDDAAAKALAAAKGDPEKEAKIRAALEKAAALKAKREAEKNAGAAN